MQQTLSWNASPGTRFQCMESCAMACYNPHINLGATADFNGIRLAMKHTEEAEALGS